MTRPEVTWGEPQNMPTDIELEPVTGKALQEFGRYQSVVYNLPKMVSLLVEPWYALVGEREQVLGLMRAIICQLAFSHGPDHVQMIVVSSDLDQWDWVKWLPHFGDSRRHDAAGNARMVYTSVREFAAEQAELFAGRGSFTPRHASSSAQTPTPHTVIIADVDDPQWEYVISAEGVDGVTFFDLTGSSMWTDIPERKLQFDKTGVIEALPRDRDTWMVIDDKAWFFALTDQVSIAEAEEFAQKLAQWRLAEAYEEIGQRVAHIGARDILSYYGIDDPGNIDFDSLWASRTDTMGRSRLRAPFGNRSDNGELLFLDMKSLDEGGDGPHGVMSGTTGSGKSTLVRTVIESLMLSHPPEELQFVLADLKGGSAVKPFAECHTCRGSSPTSKKTRRSWSAFWMRCGARSPAAKQYATAPVSTTPKSTTRCEPGCVRAVRTWRRCRCSWWSSTSSTNGSASCRRRSTSSTRSAGRAAPTGFT